MKQCTHKCWLANICSTHHINIAAPPQPVHSRCSIFDAWQGQYLTHQGQWNKTNFRKWWWCTSCHHTRWHAGQSLFQVREQPHEGYMAGECICWSISNGLNIQSYRRALFKPSTITQMHNSQRENEEIIIIALKSKKASSKHIISHSTSNILSITPPKACMAVTIQWLINIAEHCILGLEGTVEETCASIVASRLLHQFLMSP